MNWANVYIFWATVAAIVFVCTVFIFGERSDISKAVRRVLVAAFIVFAVAGTLAVGTM